MPDTLVSTGPTNPGYRDSIHKRRAEEFRASLKDAQSTTPTQPAANTPPVQLPDSVPPVQNTPAQPQNPISANDFAAALTGQQAQTGQPQSPAVDDSALKAERERSAKLEAELSALRAEREKERETYNRVNAELAQFRASKELDEVMNSIGDTAGLAKDDMRKLAGAIMQQLGNKQQVLEKQIADRTAAVDRKLADEGKARQQDFRTIVYNNVLKAVPNAGALLQSQAFQQMRTRPAAAGSGLTVGTLLDKEFELGNSDYVIAVLKQLDAEANGTSNASAVASVNPQGSAPAMAAPDTGTAPANDLEELQELNRLVSTGQITRDEYRKKVSERRARKASA